MIRGAKVAVFVFGVNARRVGGIECHTRETLCHLEKHGWQAVLCFDGAPSPEVREYLSLPNVLWDELPDASRMPLEACLRLRRILRQYRPRMLHLQFAPFLSPAPWIARLSGVRTIAFTDHHSHSEGARPKRASALKRAAGRFLTAPVSLIVTVSEFNRRILAAAGTCRPSRVHLIYNGADLELADSGVASPHAFRLRHDIPADRILVTQVSSVNPEKGIPELLEAARMALAREPRLHFAIVGDGKRSAEYAGRAEELGIADRVTWAGLSKNPMAEGVFAASDIACQASRWEEAFGLVIAEAMAFARPVVATRAGGIPEVVADGETGILVNRGDTVALAQAFVRLAQNPELRQRQGAAGQQRASRLFDVRRNVCQLIELYGEFQQPLTR